MPRIRTIKPEFWADEKLAPMCVVDRLVFLGLISLADDAGRLLDNVKAVDGFVFPESEDTSRESLARLAEKGRIVRYESSSGQRLVQIANWKKHQKIDHPSKYVLPAPPRSLSRDPREDDAQSSGVDLGPTTSTSDQRPTTYDQGAERPATVTSETDDVDHDEAPRAAGPAPLSQSTKYDDLPPDLIEFGARFYQRAPAERRRKIANQLLRLAKGEGVRFKGGLVTAGSLERLALKCREVLDDTAVRKPDAAIAVLLAKLADSTELTAAARKREELQRGADNRRTAVDMSAAEAWLEVNSPAAGAIDEELERQGYAAGRTQDAISAMARTWARRGLVIRAWRDAGAPEAIAS